jgi:hypothetical protein
MASSLALAGDVVVFALGLAHEGMLRLGLPHAPSASAMALLARCLRGGAADVGADAVSATHPLLAAMACVLLSAKAHDVSPMPSVRSIVIVFCHVARARLLGAGASFSSSSSPSSSSTSLPSSSSSSSSSEPLPRPMSLISSQHQVWCDEVRKTENVLLKFVGFNLYATLQEHAHSYLLLILRSLDIDTTEKENKNLIATAWVFLNDAWFIAEGAGGSPRVVAAAALLSAARTCARSLPSGWSRGISDADVETVISSVKSLRQSKTAAIPRWIPHSHDAALMLISAAAVPATMAPTGSAKKSDKASKASKPVLAATSASRLVPRQLKKKAPAKKGTAGKNALSLSESKADVGANGGDAGDS